MSVKYVPGNLPGERDTRVTRHISALQILITRVPDPFTGERGVFPANGAGTTACPHAKEGSTTLTSHHIQELTQYGSKA